MRIIRPIEITGANLIATNVPDVPPAAYNGGTTYADGDLAAVLQADGYTWKVYESLAGGNTGNAVTDDDWWLYLADTYAEWLVGTTYNVNDIVISTTTNHAYQSLQAANTGHSLDDPAWWLDLGATNRHAMFDQSNTTQTLRAELISTEVQVDGRADAVSLLNIVGATVQVIMETVEDGELYNETFNLVSDSGITNWYEYFFEPVVRRGDFTLYDLPLNKDPVITVILNEPGAIAKIGALVIGQSRYLGYVIHPMRTGIQDYSRIEADEFGNFTIIRRNFSKRATFKVAVEESSIDSLSALLADFRATAAVWVGVENFTSSWIYGPYREFSFDHSSPNDAYLNLEIQGLT